MPSPRKGRALQARINSSRAKHRVPKNGKGTGEGLTATGGSDCWCGKPFRHDWPGKDVGKPHPR